MAKKNNEIIIEKSLWGEKRKFWKFYCPHCKVERRIPTRPNPFQFGFLFKIFIATVFFMMLTWSVFQWKGFVIFFPLWIIFEVYFRLRVRSSLICERCGFDPVLFLRDVKLAKKEVEKFWEKKLKPVEENKQGESNSSSEPEHGGNIATSQTGDSASKDSLGIQNKEGKSK